MDVVKANSMVPVQATEGSNKSKQVAQQARSEEKPDASAAQKSADNQPKPTTNTRGEKLGQRLNAVA
jgi:hypothetical protein